MAPLAALAALSLATSFAAPCTLGPAMWVGGKSSINVSAEDARGNFRASAAGAWQDAPGVHYANGTVWLGDSGPGITGTVDAACARIAWADGVGSVWTRPAPRVPFNATISNLVPRRDDTGAIMRVQDGCLQNFGGSFNAFTATPVRCVAAQTTLTLNPTRAS
jgi:hypothetical protein